VEYNGLVDAHLRQWTYFDNTLRYNAEVSFMAEDEFVNIRSGRYSRDILITVECTNRSCDFDTNYNIIDIAVFVLLHT
jgi:hypothetical protein